MFEFQDRVYNPDLAPLKLKSRFIAGFLALSALAPLAFYAQLVFSRPPSTGIAETLIFEGVTYARETLRGPVPAIIHLVEIDLSLSGIEPVVTTPGAVPGAKYHAKTTSQFVKDAGVQIAVNASFFYPFSERSIFDFRPRAGDETTPLGVVISNGVRRAAPRPQYPSLCLLEGFAVTRADGDCPAKTKQAVAGKVLVERSFAPQRVPDVGRPYPITLAGLDDTGTKLFLMIVDGKQPFYSEGMRLRDAVNLIFERGAVRALQLDGGGSTTLVIADREGVRVLNSPIHTKVPGRERPVATHLGPFARDIAAVAPL